MKLIVRTNTILKYAILKRRNLEICEHSSFLLLTKLSFKLNLEFRNLKITKLSQLTKPIKVFKHLQLISIKNFNVPLDIFLFNYWKNRMLADFYIYRLSNDMQIAFQKNYLGVKFSNKKNGVNILQKND